jgi:photosystem II stability/assembly factor-like uncharacterized protein
MRRFGAAILAIGLAGSAWAQIGGIEEIRRLQERIEQLRGELDSLRGPMRPDPRAHLEADAGRRVLPESWLEAIPWRSIGPGTMGGRIVRIQALDRDPNTFWAATASGGLFKTTDGGKSFEAQFQNENTVSIGDVAVSQSNPQIVWIGTGEHNPRNSSSYGDGVYKSTDGGTTWEHKGLDRAFVVGRIAIHPANADIVYVGVMGRTWGRNPERGLYKTTDGGDSWEKILYVADDAGVIEVQMHPTDAETLLVATWGRMRDGFDGNDPAYRHTPESGLWKTTNGGRSFKRVTAGLPTVNLGRIGLDYFDGDPNVVFAVVDSEKIGQGDLLPPPAARAPDPAPEREGSDAIQWTDEQIRAAVARLGDSVGGRAGELTDARLAQIRQFLGQLGPEELRLLAAQYGADLSAVAGGQRRGAGEGGQQRGGAAVRIEQFQPPPVQMVAYLGAQGEDARGGARLTRIVAGGPAEQAGLQADDLVVSVGDAAVTNHQTLIEAIRERSPGDTIVVTYRRGEAIRTARVELGVDPRAIGAAQTAPPQPAAGGRRGGGPGAETEIARASDYLGGQHENLQHRQGPEGYQTGGAFKSTDGGDTWARVNSLNPRPMYFSQIRVDPSDANKIFVLGISMHYSEDGGETFVSIRAGHADHHAVWIDPNDGERVIVGNDGGITMRTRESAGRFEPIKVMSIGQYYDVDVDRRRLYHVAGGLQDNGTYYGPSMTRGEVGPLNEDFFSIGGGDGFVVQIDPDDHRTIYLESQNGNIRMAVLRPETEAQRVQSARLQPPAAPDGGRIRFNWKTPFILSPHSSRIYYVAGDYALKSSNQGQNLRVISPRLAATEDGTGSAIANSPRNPEVLYVGTTDGALWLTRDGGAEWARIDGNVDLPGPRWVSAIEASRFAEGRVYVSFDGHRSDDDNVYFFVSEDFGATFASIRGNIPAFGSAHVVREDPVNPNLLFAGTEFAAWVSIDRGGDWTRFGGGMPTVAVHDFAFSDRAGEVVAATHGRGLWAMEVAALRQISPDVALLRNYALLTPQPAVLWEAPGAEESARRLQTRSRQYEGENPPFGATIHYAIAQGAREATVAITAADGAAVARLDAETGAGLHRTVWDLKDGSGDRVQPGEYRVALTVDGRTMQKTLRVVPDPGDEDGSQ